MPSARSRPSGLLTAKQVKAHRRWGPLLSMLPGYDPCALAGECRFDVAAAERVLAFFPAMLKHTEPPFSGMPFELQPWQAAFVANLFGWVKPNGARRYRQAFLYVPKKNGKSALLAGITLYVLLNAPEGAKMFGAASAQDQAAILYGHAAGMVGQNEHMRALVECYGDSGGTVRKSLVWAERRVTFKVLCANAATVDGVATYFAAIDELHRHESSALSTVLVKGGGSQKEPLVIFTTTADYNRKSTCNDRLAYAKAVRDNRGDDGAPGFDATFLPAVWEAPKGADWRSEDTWRAANPSYGVTVTPESMHEALREVEQTPSELNNLLRLNLNIVTDADQAWLSKDDWAACRGPKMESVDGDAGGPMRWAFDLNLPQRTGAAAIDLAATTDLSAMVVTFSPETEGGAYHLLPFFWIPRETMARAEHRDRVPYSQWARDGFLTVTEGNVADYVRIQADVLEILARLNVSCLAYDPWASRQMALALAEAGLTCIEFKQQPSTYAEPMRLFERAVKSGRIVHGGHPVLTWNAGNVSVYRDGNGNMKPMKNKSTGRIDGIVAAVMSLGLLTLNAPAPAGDIESAYAPGEGIYL